MSIGKSSLARAAAATARPTAETAPKQDTMTACAVAVDAIRLPKGHKLPAVSADLPDRIKQLTRHRPAPTTVRPLGFLCRNRISRMGTTSTDKFSKKA